MEELIAPFEMVYRSKLDKSIFAKYITISNTDSKDNYELVTEVQAERERGNNYEES